jgi:hypothetical protein
LIDNVAKGDQSLKNQKEISQVSLVNSEGERVQGLSRIEIFEEDHDSEEGQGSQTNPVR